MFDVKGLKPAAKCFNGASLRIDGVPGTRIEWTCVHCGFTVQYVRLGVLTFFRDLEAGTLCLEHAMTHKENLVRQRRKK